VPRFVDKFVRVAFKSPEMILDTDTKCLRDQLVYLEGLGQDLNPIKHLSEDLVEAYCFLVRLSVFKV